MCYNTTRSQLYLLQLVLLIWFIRQTTTILDGHSCHAGTSLSSHPLSILVVLSHSLQSEKRVAYLTDRLSAAQARLQEMGAPPLNSPRASPTPSYLSGHSNHGSSYGYGNTFGSSYATTSTSSSNYPSLSPISSTSEVERLQEQVRRLSSELVRLRAVCS